MTFDIDSLNFVKGDGFVTVVAQDVATGAVLMVARTDRDCLERTIASGEMHYHSRTRGVWHKGATSGNVQRVVSLSADCDGDALLAVVDPAGPACHTGATSCFSTPIGDALAVLDATIAARAADTTRTASYTRKLLDDRNLRLKKLGEEAAELVLALADGDAVRATSEAADVFYHTLVALRAVDVSLVDVRAELARRAAGR